MSRAICKIKSQILIAQKVSEQRVSLPCFPALAGMPGSFSSSSSSNAPYSKYLKLGFGSDRVRVCRGVDRSDAMDETLSKNLFTARSPLARCITRRAYSHLPLARLVR